MITWFQNLAKEEGSRWPNFRGLVARSWDSRYKLSYQVCTGLRPLAFEVQFYHGDSLGDLQIYVSAFFVSVFLTFESVLGWFPKTKDGRYRQPMTTGFSIRRDSGSISVWRNVHEFASDGSTHVFYWHWFWPWDYASASIWEVQRADGSFVKRGDNDYPDRGKEFEWPYQDGRKMYYAPYSYTLRSGEVQNVIATFFVDRMVWFKRYQRWPLMAWAKWPKIERKSISVSFSDEVGERAGSWKGGCIGCSYEMLPDEQPVDTLRRMERERKFT